MIKYIIVDDETASHDIIKDYANNLSYLSFQKSTKTNPKKEVLVRCSACVGKIKVYKTDF